MSTDNQPMLRYSHSSKESDYGNESIIYWEITEPGEGRLNFHTCQESSLLLAADSNAVKFITFSLKFTLHFVALKSNNFYHQDLKTWQALESFTILLFKACFILLHSR